MLSPAASKVAGVVAVAALGYSLYTIQMRQDPLASQTGKATSASPKTVQSTLSDLRSRDPLAAICVLQPDGGSGVSGVVNFRQDHPQAPVQITARVTGLKDGLHGFHIHEVRTPHPTPTPLSSIHSALLRC